MLVGLAFGEDEQPDLFANPRPYPFFVPLQATEDAPQFRNNINNFLNGFRPPESLPRSAFQGNTQALTLLFSNFTPCFKMSRNLQLASQQTT